MEHQGLKGTECPLVSVDEGPFRLSRDQLERLWKRFLQSADGFVSFAEPGEALERGELAYKRRALKRFAEEIGRDGWTTWIEGGRAAELIKRLNSLPSVPTCVRQSAPSKLV